MNSKKVYLIYTSNSRLYPYFPSSSLALAGELFKAGYEPVIVDSELEDWKKYDLSDALCVCITTFTGPWLGSALEISKEIKKKYKELKVFWGGPHAIALPDITAKHEAVDAVCYTEGEGVITGLVENVYKGIDDYSNIKGLMFKDKSGAVIKTDAPELFDMDKLVFPPYEALNPSLYPIKTGRVYYQSSRGCPYKCRFCVSENMTRWRGKSPDKVISEFDMIVKKFNPEEIQIFDGNFFADINRVREILKRKIEKKYTFNWIAYCRFDTFARLKEEDLALLKSSGCIELKFGGESGSEKILEYVDKKSKAWYITEGVKRAMQYNIRPTLSFMVGFPKETEEDFNKTLDLINKLKAEHPGIAINGLFMLQHLPNTPLTEEVKRDYNIKQPDTLEGWVSHHMTWTKREDYPWMSSSEYRFKHTLSSIQSYLYISDVLRAMPETQRKGTVLKSDILYGLFKLGDKVIRNIFVKLRWDKRITVFPLEWHIWDFVRKNILRTC